MDPCVARRMPGMSLSLCIQSIDTTKRGEVIITCTILIRVNVTGLTLAHLLVLTILLGKGGTPLFLFGLETVKNSLDCQKPAKA